MELKQNTEQRVSFDTALIQQRLHISKIAAIIEGRTVQELVRLCANVHDASGAILSEQNMNGIAARLARSTVFRLANQEIFPNPSESVNDFDLIETITDAVIEEFSEWWKNRDAYHAVSDSFSERTFTERHGPIDWESVKTSRRVVAEGTRCEPNGDERADFQSRQTYVAETVGECVANLEHMFGIDPKMRAVFERVRTAEYGRISKANIDELIEKIRASYKRAWLQPETIELLRDNDPEKAREFARKTEKGVFVFGFDESVNGQPSVGDHMYRDFKADRSPNEPTYEGRYLMDDNGELLAWFTYWQTPKSPSEKHRSMIGEYLDHGVTGGVMSYRRDPPKKNFKKKIDQTLMIDTLRGGAPFAAARLISRAASEIREFNSNVTTLLGYRVYSLQMKPAFPGFREPIRITENLNSSRFFAERSCAPFAYDYSKKGPMSERILSDQSRMFLNPEWVAFSGSFDAFLNKSKALWKEIQQKYGDVTHDKKESSHP